MGTISIGLQEVIHNSKKGDGSILIALKVMAIAQKDLYAKGNHDIFLRCDYSKLGLRMY
ncbi:hypothetical protein [Alkaliphilus crotonatoxidans]